MTVLVVGGSGVLGSALVADLETDHAPVMSLSRHPAPVGPWVRGDVRRPGLGVDEDAVGGLCARITHIVSAFGSVDLSAGPGATQELHALGTRNLLDLARRCPNLRRVVHVSSVLVFGRCVHPVGNTDLDVGQTFRSWYEVGKFTAEGIIQDATDLPTRIVRLGPVLGGGSPVQPTAPDGILGALRYLLQSRPVPLRDRGDFPCYAGDSTVAASVIRAALSNDDTSDTWTWFDPMLPTLNQVLTALCSPWGIVPRIVDLPGGRVAAKILGPAFGFPRTLADYADYWVRIRPEVLDELPFAAPHCPPGYLRATTEPLRSGRGELFSA